METIPLEICDGEQMRPRSWEDVSDNRAHNTQAQDSCFALLLSAQSDASCHPDSLVKLLNKCAFSFHPSDTTLE